MLLILGYSVHQWVKFLLTQELISWGNVLNDDADAENSNSSSDGRGREHGVCPVWSLLLKKRSACRWAFGIAMRLSSCRAWMLCRAACELREFPHLCTCSRTGFPRLPPGRLFCVLAVSPPGHLQGLTCYGLKAWMRFGSPDCSCITNWSIKGWDAAQGSFKDTIQTCLGATSKPRPLSSSLQKGRAGEGNLIKGRAFACLSPLPRRQG